jgi:hypothetical protein
MALPNCAASPCVRANFRYLAIQELERTLDVVRDVVVEVRAKPVEVEAR